MVVPTPRNHTPHLQVGHALLHLMIIHEINLYYRHEYNYYSELIFTKLSDFEIKKKNYFCNA